MSLWGSTKCTLPIFTALLIAGCHTIKPRTSNFEHQQITLIMSQENKTYSIEVTDKKTVCSFLHLIQNSKKSEFINFYVWEPPIIVFLYDKKKHRHQSYKMYFPTKPKWGILNCQASIENGELQISGTGYSGLILKNDPFILFEKYIDVLRKQSRAAGSDLDY